MAGSKSDQPSDSPDRSNAAQPVNMRKRQYIVATARVPGVQPIAMNIVEESLRNNPNVEVIKTISPAGLVGAFVGDLGAPSSVMVVRMHHDHAQALQMQAVNRLHIEEDLPLRYARPLPTMDFAPTNPGLVTALHATQVSVVVTGTNNTPIVGADVTLYGTMWPAQGVTDQQGRAVLQLIGDTVDNVQGLFINPKADYWNFYGSYPELSASADNTVVLSPLSATIPQFPQKQVLGWGQKAMRLDQLPPTCRGKGAKIAVIDSGAATRSHRDLRQPLATQGYDTTGSDDTGWQLDEVGHGSHCTGTIAGLFNNSGIMGFAPEAEIFEFKIFPGGRFSNLIDALNHCIEQQVDVVNLSLGAADGSLIVEQKLQQLRSLGIACIVAAGNSAGAVQFPASSPSVLAVSAIGKVGEFPDTTYHAAQILQTPNADGYFPARFSCFGSQVGVCGPGVAIVSSVPNDNYAAWDGTSMATPHITGLAALVVAHHPDFQIGASFAAHNSARVDRLFNIIKASAKPLNFGDPGRTGAGLPDALRALNLETRSSVEHPTNTEIGRTLNELGAYLAQVGILPTTEPSSTWRTATSPFANAPSTGGSAPFGTRSAEATISTMAVATTALKQAGLLS